MNWTHLHLALNHLPVLSVPFVAIVFLIALRRRDVAWQRLALWGFVALFFVALAAKLTGDFAHEQVVTWPEFDHDLMHVHEEASDQAVAAVFLLGLFSGAGLFLSRAGRSLPKWIVATVLVLALTGTVLLLRTANFGGQIRHPEIRPGFQPPAVEQS
ncbi:MAG: hypothetical protein EXS29_08075 [Pedosphaera sp.]|nr:hypothetical protein [Pedosphaera sp.]